MAKRVSSWRIVGLSLLALAVGAGLTYAWLEWRTARRWEEMGREVEALMREEAPRVLPRVSLRAFTLEGNAWTDYRKAVDGAAAYKNRPAWSFLEGFLRSDNPDHRGEVKSLLAGQGPILEALTSGTRRKGLDYVDREARLRGGGVSLSMPFFQVVCLALCDGRLRLAVGDSPGALERVIDVLQFSRDWAESGAAMEAISYGTGLYYVMAEVERLLLAGSLSPAQELELDRVLAGLDALPPRSDALLWRAVARDAARARFRGLRGLLEDLQLSADRVRPGFLHLFSERRFLLGCYTNQREMAAGAARREEWEGAREREFWASYERIGYGQVVGIGDPYLVYHALRPSGTRLKLMRAALAWRRTGVIPVLPDPCGDTLRGSLSGDVLMLWSVGMNGIDDGGGSRDIVIRARR